MGETVYSRPVCLEAGNNTLQAELGALTNGFYFVEINCGGSSQSQKLSGIR
ncbi:MAG: hypothetical protein IPP77_02730 [Bacteroidetes bacterium]|nr:hypothetical protein [Bacteroidota bacterium]